VRYGSCAYYACYPVLPSSVSAPRSEGQRPWRIAARVLTRRLQLSASVAACTSPLLWIRAPRPVRGERHRAVLRERVCGPLHCVSGIASWKCRSLAGKGLLTGVSSDRLLCSYSPPRACPQRQTHSRLGEPLL